MQVSQTSRLKELQTTISRMPLQVCCVMVLPEFGVKWKDVSRAVRTARLPMTAASVARVLTRHVAKSLPTDELDEILSRLRLKLVATQSRTWHVITLSEQETPMSITEVLETMPDRIENALKKGKNRFMRPEIQSLLLGDLMYVSLQMLSDNRAGTALYMAVAGCEPRALVSSLGPSALIQACVAGLGYKKYTDAKLHGRDIPSLLRIHDRTWNGPADNLADIPEYAPIPTLTATGIDYTNKNYDENYVDNILGPNPPLLTDLSIKTVKPFFDQSMLDKKISLKIQLKSEDVAKTLKSWVVKGALSPTSEFFHIFHSIKSNKITNVDDSD